VNTYMSNLRSIKYIDVNLDHFAFVVKIKQDSHRLMVQAKYNWQTTQSVLFLAFITNMCVRWILQALLEILVLSATMLKPKIEKLKLDVKVKTRFNEVGTSYIKKVYNENFDKFL
jgi:hypothetical protein